MGREKFRFIAIFALLLAALGPAGVFAGDAAAAKRDLFRAKDSAESDRWDSVDEAMKKVAADMQGLSDTEKAPFLAGIAEVKAIATKSVEAEVTKRLDKAAGAGGSGSAKFDIDRAKSRLDSDEAKNYADPAVINKLRARIASMTGAPVPAQAPAPTTPTPTPTAKGPMSDDLLAATTHAHSAHAMFDQDDRSAAQSQIQDTMKYLERVPEADRAPVLADMVALSKQIDEADRKAQLAEEYRKADSWAHQYVFDAENSIQNGIVCPPDKIDKAQERLARHDVQTYLSPEQVKVYQDKLDGLRVKLKEHNRTVAIQRSAGNLKELEDGIARDPFKGKDSRQAYDVYNGLHSLSVRIHDEFYRVDKNDPAVKAVFDRVAAADAKVDAAAGAWAIDGVQKQFVAKWQFSRTPSEGWESETLSPDSPAKRRIEGLNKTAQAVGDTVYWLNDRDTVDIAEKYKSNAVIQATVLEARKTLEAASAKLNDAFNTVLIEAERQPMPRRETDRLSIGELGRNAASWFAGTKYRDKNVARAEALDAKWKADVARAEKEMAEALKKLTEQANAAWPMIELKSGAGKGFNPSEADSWKGKTVVIKGYYNRSGWDFDGAYDFAVDIKGKPVGGNYDPHVLEAFKEGSRHTQFGIDDHIGWDVIAVVEGRGEIKRRTITEVRDINTHALIMKVEHYVPEPCVMLKIIGLHAGPVAVGPK